MVHNEGNKTKAEKDSEGPPIDRTTKPNTISGNEFSDLHGQQHMVCLFNLTDRRAREILYRRAREPNWLPGGVFTLCEQLSNEPVELEQNRAIF